MKKAITVLLALVPYGFFAGIGCLILFDLDSDVALFDFFALYLLLGIVTAILYGIFGKSRYNLWVKLAAVPADCFAIGFLILRAIENNRAMEDGAMGVGLSIFVLLLFGFFYFLPRIASGIACAVVCGRDPKTKSIHTLLHLLPIADLVSAALIRKNVQPL